MSNKCPFCGNKSFQKKHGDFHFTITDDGSNPDALEFETIIPDSDWEECPSCKEILLSKELDRQIENWQYTREGLLTPDELKQIRKEFGLSQVEIAKYLGVGEKSYTRWENRLSIQSKAMDNLIRLFYDDPENYFDLNEKIKPYPIIKKKVASYLESLEKNKTIKSAVIAAHGGSHNDQNIEKLDKIIKREKKTRKKPKC
ncbi:MAG TPA: type II toxin-antitoxin system MqsA family antitoxin [bacterium]|nr:type II toxin-antitoxin system MqsA family antitoxin [bacterium]